MSIVASAVSRAAALAAADLTPAQLSHLFHPPVIAITSLQTAHKGSSQGTSLIGLIVVFVLLQQYSTWTLIGVAEEKSSRVVEVLLAAVRPMQLLGGKVLGIGLVALAQAGTILVFAVVLAKAVGSDLCKGPPRWSWSARSCGWYSGTPSIAGSTPPPVPWPSVRTNSRA